MVWRDFQKTIVGVFYIFASRQLIISCWSVFIDDRSLPTQGEKNNAPHAYDRTVGRIILRVAYFDRRVRLIIQLTQTNL